MPLLKNKSNYSLLLLTLVVTSMLSLSCKSKIVKKKIIKDVEYDTINIGLNENLLNSYTMHSAVSTVDGHEFFIGFNPKLNTLDLYSLDQEKYSHSVAISAQGPNAIPALLSFNFYNGHRFFESQIGFYLTNIKGEIVKKVPSKDIEKYNYSLIFSGLNVNNFNRLSLDKKHHRVYFPVFSSLYTPIESEYYEQSHIGSWNLETDSVEILDIPYPKFLKHDYYAGLSIPYISVKGDSIIYNFPASSHVFIYDGLTRKLSSVNIESSYTKNKCPAIEKNADIGTQYRYRLESRQFFPVEYDPYRNLYYRVHYDEMPSDKLPFNRTLYLTIMDESFDVVKEIVLSDQLYPFFHVSRKGILFQYTMGLDGELLTFLLLKPTLENTEKHPIDVDQSSVQANRQEAASSDNTVKPDSLPTKVPHSKTAIVKKPIFSNDSLSAQIMRHVKRNLRYPPEALEAKKEGIVQIILVYDSNKKLKNIRTEMWGDTVMEFKEEALRVTKLLPNLDIGDNSIVSFPVVFQLNRP